ncbi:SNF2-like protein [Penicillium malachiteum]|nr:SNF2-like protein [Penicillium malachiteum]
MPPDKSSEKPLATRNIDPYTCKDAEVRIAAYLGMRLMSHFRQLLFSWPFLKATMRLHDTWKNLPRAKVLETLKVHLEHFENADGDEIEKGFEADEKDTHDQVTAKRYRKAAWCLFQLDKDLAKYHSLSDEENTQEADEHLGPCLGALSTEHLLQPTMNALRHPKLNFGPHAGEVELERFNRYAEIVKQLESAAANIPKKGISATLRNINL